MDLGTLLDPVTSLIVREEGRGPDREAGKSGRGPGWGPSEALLEASSRTGRFTFGKGEGTGPRRLTRKTGL